MKKIKITKMGNKYILKLMLVCSLLSICVLSSAQEDEYTLKPIRINSSSSAKGETGAYYLIDAKKLKDNKVKDVHEALNKVPGVYIQEEDGFGLRPNIGMRGAQPHRSEKITLMMDGVLVSPAPYSSPAAYYFPVMSKVDNIEVFKGPAAIKYGPQSIGGAVNLISKGIPEDFLTQIDLEYGSFNYQKYGLLHGGKYKQIGWLLDGTIFSSDGFKELNGLDTGFKKWDLNTKFQWEPATEFYQNFLVNVVLSNESSNETYLGLTEADFNRSPYRRYAASREDNMSWDNQSIRFKYSVMPKDNLFIWSNVYYHDFRRNWKKLGSSFKDGTSLSQVVKTPSGQFEDYFKILSGQVATPTVTDGFDFYLQSNARNYISKGADINGEWTFYEKDKKSQKLIWGSRWHQDQVNYNHVRDQFSLVGTGQNSKALYSSKGALIPSGQKIIYSKSLSFYLIDEIQLDRLKINLGGRFDRVEMDVFDKTPYLTSSENQNSKNYFTPGIGFNYKWNESLNLAFGVHKGISPISPGQSDDVEEEESINYELGFVLESLVNAQVFMFYNDYKNIVGKCSQSSGCDNADLGKEYNGGKARAYGAELSLATQVQTKRWEFPLSVSGTLTKSEFLNNFSSGAESWGVGDIKKGDPIPYLPTVKWNLHAGVKRKNIAANLNFTQQTKMADQAVKVDSKGNKRKEVGSYGILNLNLSYAVNKKLEIYAKANNILDREYAVSFRPQGLRPGTPQNFLLGLSYKF